MDTMKQVKDLAAKYKYVLIVVLAGLFLMLLPGKETSEIPAAPEPVSETSMQESLETILSKIQGVGKVQVLLTEAAGSQTLYVYDESASGESLQSDAVIITDSTRAQTGLISQVIPPVYLGAVVVCQGGDIAPVKLAVVQAVQAATGLSADKITVLKMK